MKKKLGNVFGTSHNAIGHGVNLEGIMGAGVAKEWRERFPESYEGYRKACLSDGDYGLGHALVIEEEGFYTFNICTQEFPGPDAKYWLVLAGLCDTGYKMNELGLKTIAIPMIGCGIGGLEWDRVEKIILAVEATYDIEFEVWKFNG